MPGGLPPYDNLPHSPTLPPPVTAKQRVVKFHEMSLKKGFKGKKEFKISTPVIRTGLYPHMPITIDRRSPRNTTSLQH